MRRTSFNGQSSPQIDVQFNIGSEPKGDEVHEVSLKININASTAQGQVYIVELSYCGLIGMRNIPEDQAHAFLFAEAPRLLFPFARRVIADAVRDAGFPPLMVDPIDFATLYTQQLQAAQAERAASEGGAGAPGGNA